MNPKLSSEHPPALPPDVSEPHFVLRDPEQKPHRWRRALFGVGAALGTTVTAVVAIAGGALLHLDLPPARRLLAGTVNTALATNFKGQIRVERIGGIGMGGLDNVAATILAPDGSRVLFLDGVRARISLPRTAWSAIAGKGPIELTLSELDIAYVEAVLAQEADGSFTIARTFEPRTPPPPKDPNEPPGRGLAIAFPHIALNHGWVHGGLAALPLIDGDLDALDGAFNMGGGKTQIDLRKFHLNTRSMPQHADANADIEAHLVLPDVGQLGGSVVFVGTVGGIGTKVNGGIDGDKVDAVVDVPRAEAEQIRAMLATAPVYAPVTAHIEAHGTLPEITPTAHVTVGDGVLDVDGKVHLARGTETAMRADANVRARNFDVRSFSQTGPASNLGADVRASAVMDNGHASGKYDLRVVPGVVAAQAVPEVHAQGTFADASVKGTAHIAEPGAPVDLTYALHDGNDLDFEATTKADLQGLHRVKIGAGLVSLHAAGNVGLKSQAVRAHAEVQVDRFASGGAVVDHLTLAAIVDGSLADPQIDANIAGSGLRAGGMLFDKFAVTAQGTAEQPMIAAKLSGPGSPTIEAKATLATKGSFGAKDIDVSIAREDVTMRAQVASVATGNGAIDAQGVSITGLGEPIQGELHMRPGAMKAAISSRGIDLKRVARLAEVKQIDDGVVGLDVNVDARRDRANGHVIVDLHNTRFGGMKTEADAHLDVNLDGRKVDGRVDLDLRKEGRATITLSNVLLDGNAMSGRSWMRATGKAAIDGALDLGALVNEMPNAMPIEHAHGWIGVHAVASRETKTGIPDLQAAVMSSNLSLVTRPSEVLNPDGTVQQLGQPLRIAHLGFSIATKVDAKRGDVDFGAQIADAAGPLVGMDAHTTMPLEKLAAGANPQPILLAAPIKAHVQMPEHALDTLPDTFGKIPMKGRAALDVDFEGTARAPRAHVGMRLKDVVSINETKPVPISADMALNYDGEQAKLMLVATRPEGKIIDASGVASVRAAELVDPARTAPPAWDASGKIVISKFPVEALADFTGMDIKGALSGTVDLKDLHKAAALDARFDLNDIVINRAKFEHAAASLTATNGKLNAGARIEQKDGYADVRATGAMHWGREIAPSVDQTSPIEIALDAKKFRLKAVEPFVEDVFSELDGRLDADAKIHVKPGGKDGTVDGAIILRDGVIESPALGEQLHAVQARVIMKPWGTIRVEDVSANGLTGRMTASATAQLDGVQFKQAQGQIRIKQSEKLPIAMQGVPFGEAWGAINATARVDAAKKQTAIEIDIPDLHVDLPQSTAHGVQSLDADPDIKVGTRGSDGRLIVIPLGPPAPPPKPPSDSTMKLVAKLKDIEVKRDTTLKVHVNGQAEVDSGTKTQISGQLHLPEGGYIEVQGKRFTIEKGVVNFDPNGDPGNPTVVATAVYEAPDVAHTRVYADFVGPVKTGKLTLRSEPSLSQNEILSLLLFGTSSGSVGSSPPPGTDDSDAAKAAGLAGGVVTEGLNKAISGVTPVEITTNVDTSQSTNPRPEVEVQVSREVSAKVLYSLGVPPPGQNPDTTLLVVDWRFVRNWSADATLGDKGTSILDFTWKYRY